MVSAVIDGIVVVVVVVVAVVVNGGGEYTGCIDRIISAKMADGRRR